MLAFAELSLGVIVRVVAVHSKVPIAQVEHLMCLDGGERALLGLLAPWAAPFVPALLAMVPKIAAAGFGLAFVACIAERTSQIKSIARDLATRRKRDDDRPQHTDHSPKETDASA